MGISFWGSHFMRGPVMLEYTHNKCSNGCVYCYMNNTALKFKDECQSVVNQFTKPRQPTLVNELITRKYPIAMSTGTDPFCKPNIKTTETILQYMKLNGNGLLAYTKGGDIDAILGCVEGHEAKTMFHIGITTLDENISKRIEPNAPLPKQRIELARKAKEKGVKVALQINPYTKYWMKDEMVQDFIKICNDLDVKDVYLSFLRLHSKIWGNYEYEFDVKEYTRGNFVSNFAEMEYLMFDLRDANMNVVMINIPHETEISDIYTEAFGDKLFPYTNNIYSYIGKAYREQGKDEFTLDDIYNGITTSETREVLELPTKKSWIWGAVKACLNNPQDQSEPMNRQFKSFKDFIYYVWQHPKAEYNLRNQSCFDIMDKPDSAFTLKLNADRFLYIMVPPEDFEKCQQELQLQKSK